MSRAEVNLVWKISSILISSSCVVFGWFGDVENLWIGLKFVFPHISLPSRLWLSDWIKSFPLCHHHSFSLFLPNKVLTAQLMVSMVSQYIGPWDSLQCLQLSINYVLTHSWHIILYNVKDIFVVGAGRSACNDFKIDWLFHPWPLHSTGIESFVDKMWAARFLYWELIPQQIRAQKT